jgi:hypothetical protein
MKRYQLINLLIKENNYKTYLEIGIHEGECFKEIICEIKDSVDPYPNTVFDKILNEYPVTYRITSDEFFENIAPNLKYKYDIVFIDGSHLSEQVDKDIENSIKYLNDNGTVVLHDCNPIDYNIQIVPRIYEYWSGDVWKSIIKLKHNRKDLSVYVIDTDTGLGVITKKESKTNDTNLDKKLDWDYFSKNRKELLNLISSTDFLLKIYKNKF